MNGEASNDRCGRVRELVPDVAAGRAEGSAVAEVERHTQECAACATELRLARAIFATRVRAPVGVPERVLAGLGERRRRVHRPWWGLAAAAVAALALGIGLTERATTDPFEALLAESEIEDEGGELWLADDGLLAGAPVLETLSDEALAELLDELAPMPNGGQA